MEEEKKVSEETKVKIPNPNPYKKDRGEEDAEVEAFAKGELAKFQREQKQKATAATEQKDTDASEETAEKSEVKATPIAERPAKAEDRVFKKRYDDLKKHYDSTLNKHKDEVKTLRSQLESSTKQFVPPKSKEELEAWRKEYPDVYEMVETIAMNKATTQTADLESKYKNLQIQQEQIAKEKAEVELLKMHPDFNEIRSQDSFHEWAANQDPTIQGWLYENTSNAKLAARAIDLFKMDSGQSKLTKKEEKDIKKEAAKAISKTRKSTESDIPKKKIWTASEISKMKPHEFEKFEKEIDLARLEGRIEQR
tara:strand:- start:348 stop:1274 length:927 start_codon:yes stop_codon:yes gene_type:complete